MSEPRRQSLFPLATMSERISAQPLARVEEALRMLPEVGDLWGFWTTPAEARLARRTAGEWRSVLETPRLIEARIFAEGLDLHWRADRGLCLRPADDGAPAEGLVGGEGWLRRERRSRLWGQWLPEAGGWYEERIPDPLRYEGLPAGPESALAFLVYREYVFRGTVEYVRYLRVEGEPR